MTLEEKKTAAIWTAQSLFNRNKTAGSSANISFIHENIIYISASGTCFGTLGPEDFAPAAMDGTLLSEKKPSKELPLHQILYRKSPDIQAVIHTHSPYCILWSFTDYAGEHPQDCIPPLTPYLKMKLGTVGLVPYERPGSPELFAALGERAEASDGFLLKQHGPVVPGKTIMDAFFALEEMEESARIAWELWTKKEFRSAGLFM